MKKKILALFLAAAMCVSFASCAVSSSSSQASQASQTNQSSNTSSAVSDTPKANALNEQGLVNEIGDGVIFQAWCWSFNTIKEHLHDLADAGFSTIQTSPINLCKEGDGGGMQLQDTADSKNNGKWYYHYQPVDYTIGNYQLGTEEEFKELCAEAKKLGMKIIVDAVVNHVSSDLNAVSDNIKNLTDEPFHDFGDIKDYSNREEVTQGNLLGLRDLNTQNKDVQNYILKYLKQCVADGASGFRYDGAKHIELPDDDSSYASDFWNVILDNGSEFQYGEILQGGTDRFADYQKIMNVTASKYGESLRSALGSMKLSTSYLDFNLDDGMSDSKIVTWVESHDNYCNDGTWQSLTEEDIILGWAATAARSGGTPLFFSRPMGSSLTNQWGDNTIGEAGSDFYKTKDVSEINKFRNNMIGLSEKLSNPVDGKNQLLMIERGTKGIVLINVGKQNINLDFDVSIPDGTYRDKIDGTDDQDYVVKDGKLTGVSEGRDITVIY